MIICLCSGPLPYHYNRTIITSYWDTEKLQAICKINLQGVQRDSLLSSHTKNSCIFHDPHPEYTYSCIRHSSIMLQWVPTAFKMKNKS